MDLLTSPLIPPLYTLLGVWVGYRLRIGSEALDRRRAMRIRLRLLALESAKVAPVKLLDFHGGISAEIQRLRLSGLEDLPLWRQRTFRIRCDELLSMGKGDLVPTPGTGPDPKENERSYKSQRVAVADLLNTIAAAG